MRIVVWALVALFFGTNLNAQSNLNPTVPQDYVPPTSNRIPTYTDAELIARIRGMSSEVISPRFDGIVRSYINTYTVKRRERTEAMLGRRVMYFPIFDKYLAEADLPSDLKFLSVVESALEPRAVSRSGAVGLWQFMPGTGKDYGLRSSSTVDQRRDPHLATQAAFKYLKRLHKRFGSWELALAAYNGGPGRVNRAIRRGRSHDFWKIRRYLPRETQNYVPAFIAATYIMHYYDLHNLYPRYPAKELQITDNTIVYRQITFNEIANITGTSVDVVKTLNPSYLRGYIPSRVNGCSVILPIAALAIFENFLGKPDRATNGMISSSIPAPSVDRSKHNDFISTTYEVESGDHLTKIATRFGCTEKDIVKWNNLTSAQLFPRQQLTLYVPKRPSRELLKPLITIPRKQLRLLEQETLPSELSTVKPVNFVPSNRDFIRPGKRDKYIYYQVRRRETLAQIAAKFPGVSPQSIMEINDFRDGQALKPGKRIKIRER